VSLLVDLSDATVKKHKKPPFWNNIKIVPYLYILPNMILFGVFMILPLFLALGYSFVKWNGLGTPKFVGLQNYSYIFKNKTFLTSLFNTLKFSIIVVPSIMMFALLFAVILNRKILFRGFFRVALYIPAIISMVAVGMTFTWLFNSKIGLINYILSSMGFRAVDWMNDPKFALIMVVVGTLWSRIGYNMVLYIAGLQGISAEYYEAATVDGANGMQKFLYITMPMLKSTHVFIFITCVIYSFRSFDLIYVMTKGGPLHSTETLVVYIYNTAFQQNQYGVANAAGVTLFALLFIFTLLRLREEKEGK